MDHLRTLDHLVECWKNSGANLQTNIWNASPAFSFPSTYLSLKVSKMPHDHNHSHSHGGGACSHEASKTKGCDHDEGGEAWALYQKVDTARLICLNEQRQDSLKDVLRPWHQRFDSALPTLDSDVDPQLLICIPFVSPVKIKSICVVGGGDEENPSRMSAFINTEVMDFSSAENTKPVQSWELTRRNHSTERLVEYPTRFTKFQNVNKLWLFVSHNYGAPSTSIMYIGLKGEFTKHKREAVQTTYESRPMKTPADLKIEEQLPKMMK